MHLRATACVGVLTVASRETHPSQLYLQLYLRLARRREILVNLENDRRTAITSSWQLKLQCLHFGRGLGWPDA